MECSWVLKIKICRSVFCGDSGSWDNSYSKRVRKQKFETTMHQISKEKFKEKKGVRGKKRKI